MVDGERLSPGDMGHVTLTVERRAGRRVTRPDTGCSGGYLGHQTHRLRRAGAEATLAWLP